MEEKIWPRSHFHCTQLPFHPILSINEMPFSLTYTHLSPCTHVGLQTACKSINEMDSHGMVRLANLRVGQLLEIGNGAIFGSMITYM